MISDVISMKTILQRIDTSVEKLTDISKDVTSLLAVHENRLAYQEKITAELKQSAEKRRDETEEAFKDVYDSFAHLKDDFHKRMDVQKVDFTNSISDVEADFIDKIDKYGKKLSQLEKWIWTAGGVLIAITFLVEKILPMLHLS